MNAQTLLTQYEANQQTKKYGVGVGVSNNSLAINADYKKLWMFLDSKTVAIGYKLDF